jgi:chromosome segregation ATPase
MSATDQFKSPRTDQSAGTYSRHLKNNDNMSMSSAKRSEFENMSQGAIVAEHRDLIQKSANYRQRKIKLKRDNDYLKKQLEKLELQIEKLEEHRDQDAEALLAQEQKLSQLKGRYRVSENPNEATKAQKTINKLAKEENQILKEVKSRLENTTEYFRDLADAAPA